MDVDTSGEVDSSTAGRETEVISSSSNHVSVNGQNGYSPSDKHSSHKSEHKDKHRDKDRDREKDRRKDHKSSSSSSKDKDRHSSSHHSSSSSKDKDRHKSSSHDKDRDGDRHKDRGDKDRERDKDKHREKDKDKHREEKKSSSSKDKDKDREHKSSKDKDKSKDEGKSASKESHRDRERGEKERDKDRDKERRDKDKSHRDKDKHKHSSSKEHHSSSHKDKHREDKHSSSRDKDRKDREKEKRSEKERSSEHKKVQEEVPAAIKYDSAKEDSVDEEEPKLVIKEEMDDMMDCSQASSCDYNMSQFKDEPKLEEDFRTDNQWDDEQDEKPEVKEEAKAEESDEDMPLAARMGKTSSTGVKRKLESDDEDDVPLLARKKVKKEKKKKKKVESDVEAEEEEDYKPVKKKEKKKKKEREREKEQPDVQVGPTKKGKKKKEEEEQEVWKWWEEKKKDDGTKWNFLEHKGPVFAPPYEPLPSNVKFFYDGQEMKLSDTAEEVAGFYAKMLDHDYTSKKIFNDNFFKDWCKMMTSKERSIITDLKKCNFKQMHAFFMDQAEKNRNRTKEEKLALKEKNEALLKEYGFCTIDGHKEKIGNFKIEPPGLFRGRGEHPKMGKLKRRVEAEDIIINCSKDSQIPQAPPGHKWKEVRHDNTVTWLASWTENVQSQVKYIMLNPSSKLKGEKDWQKYETARKLHKCIDKIRREYKDDWKSKEMRVRQRAVALYFIDRLALRAGNEKDEDQADTVGCCSLRVEHIELHERKDDKEYVVVFDFLGKDSIRYYNEVPVEKRVFKNLQLFMENKRDGDDLFDRLNTQIMNKHLNELMEGLTAKVFRTYNASWTLQQQLDQLTNQDDTVAEKILSYNRANRAVAILCNHQRAVPKGHQKSMEKLKEKIDQKRDQLHDAERQVKDAQRDAKHGSVKEKQIYDKKKKMLQRLKEQLNKLEIQETDRDENKTIALGTSKLNYLDPRISVAWCKKNGVPIEKIYNKTQRDKFRWAIDMAGPDYCF